MTILNNYDESIVIQVMEQNNTIHKFKIKKCTPLKRLFDEYHQITDCDISTVEFLFDGVAIMDEDTPLSVGLVNGSTILVFPIED